MVNPSLPEPPEPDEVARLRAEVASLRGELEATRRAWSSALEEAERRGELAITTAKAGTFEWDPRGQKVQVSAMFVRLLGLSRDDPATFDTWVSRLHPDDRERVVGEVMNAVYKDRPYDTTYRCVWRDGSIRWHTSRAKVLRDASGAPVRVLGVVIDVTERRQLEDSLDRSERLATLGELAASIAHEINNPLAYVLSNLELASAEVGPGQPALAAAVADALDGTGHVRDIVQSLRLLARPQVKELAPTELGSVIAAVERVARAEVTRTASLVTDVPCDLPLALANATQLGQVVMNLVVNAAQAMPARPIEQNRIEVAARACGGNIELTVRDNGAGIPADILPRIFDPFFTTKPTGQGTGLGLALSHRFVAAMNGTLTVDTRVGAGSTFTVTVPRATGEAAVPLAVPAPEPPLAAPAPVPAPATVRRAILLVDDDAGLRRTIPRLLASHAVTVADGGAAALALVDGGARFDAILCDVSMPGMNGPDLVAALAHRCPALAARVVYMTGNSLVLDGHVPDDAPRLEKPFTRQSLAAAMTAVLSRQASASEPVSVRAPFLPSPNEVPGR